MEKIMFLEGNIMPLKYQLRLLRTTKSPQSFVYDPLATTSKEGTLHQYVLLILKHSLIDEVFSRYYMHSDILGVLPVSKGLILTPR